MSAVLNFQQQLTTETCINCGVVFGVPVGFIDARRRDKQSFYCPNGHGQSFTEGEADRLRRELEHANKRIEMERNQTASERRRREQAERRLIAKKGQLTKLKKKVAAGDCPKCESHFDDLEQHISRAILSSKSFIPTRNNCTSGFQPPARVGRKMRGSYE